MLLPRGVGHDHPGWQSATLYATDRGWDGALTFIEEDLLHGEHTVICRVQVPRTREQILGIELAIDTCHTTVVRVINTVRNLLCKPQLNNTLISFAPTPRPGSSGSS